VYEIVRLINRLRPSSPERSSIKGILILERVVVENGELGGIRLKFYSIGICARVVGVPVVTNI
jgi:hypothetical protein